MNKILRMIDNIAKPNMKLLDVGCKDFGNEEAFLLKKLEGKNLFLYGIDKTDVKNPKFNFTQGDIEKGLPYDDNYFDIIVAGEIIEHIYNTDLFLKEIYRCLKNNGHLIITTPNTTSLNNRIHYMMGKIPEENKEHIRFFNFDRLTRYLIKTGFRVEKKLTNNIPFPITKIKSNIAVKLGDYFYSLGQIIIIRASKRKKISNQIASENTYYE
ncbi:methyltransferase domain-containing protein [Candidatus Woesearchaeota archaeon]|nr:methyltransferase domain-containing protein [Candidatus Woesearchaeota archaeon]